MTANNCDRCGGDKRGSCYEDKCEPLKRMPTYAEFACDLNSAKKELSALRESEAKAWGLIEEIGDRGDQAIRTGESCDLRAFERAICNAAAALAARKAGG